MNFLLKGVADRLFFGDRERGGQRILKDFRDGRLGAFALEVPPTSSSPASGTKRRATAGQGSAPVMERLSQQRHNDGDDADDAWHRGERDEELD